MPFWLIQVLNEKLKQNMEQIWAFEYQMLKNPMTNKNKNIQGL